MNRWSSGRMIVEGASSDGRENDDREVDADLDVDAGIYLQLIVVVFRR